MVLWQVGIYLNLPTPPCSLATFKLKKTYFVLKYNYVLLLQVSPAAIQDVTKKAKIDEATPMEKKSATRRRSVRFTLDSEDEKEVEKEKEQAKEKADKAQEKAEKEKAMEMENAEKEKAKEKAEKEKEKREALLEKEKSKRSRLQMKKDTEDNVSKDEEKVEENEVILVADSEMPEGEDKDVKVTGVDPIPETEMDETEQSVGEEDLTTGSVYKEAEKTKPKTVVEVVVIGSQDTEDDQPIITQGQRLEDDPDETVFIASQTQEPTKPVESQAEIVEVNSEENDLEGSGSQARRPSRRSQFRSNIADNSQSQNKSQPVDLPASQNALARFGSSQSRSSQEDSPRKSRRSRSNGSKSPKRPSPSSKPGGAGSIEKWLVKSPRKPAGGGLVIMAEETQQYSPGKENVDKKITEVGNVCVEETPVKVENSILIVDMAVKTDSVKNLFSEVPESQILTPRKDSAFTDVNMAPVVQLMRLSDTDFEKFSPLKSKFQEETYNMPNAEATKDRKSLKRRASLLKFSKAGQESEPSQPDNMDDIIPSSQDSSGFTTRISQSKLLGEIDFPTFKLPKEIKVAQKEQSQCEGMDSESIVCEVKAVKADSMKVDVVMMDTTVENDCKDDEKEMSQVKKKMSESDVCDPKVLDDVKVSQGDENNANKSETEGKEDEAAQTQAESQQLESDKVEFTTESSKSNSDVMNNPDIVGANLFMNESSQDSQATVITKPKKRRSKKVLDELRGKAGEVTDSSQSQDSLNSTPSRKGRRQRTPKKCVCGDDSHHHGLNESISEMSESSQDESFSVDSQEPSLSQNTQQPVKRKPGRPTKKAPVKFDPTDMNTLEDDSLGSECQEMQTSSQLKSEKKINKNDLRAKITLDKESIDSSSQEMEASAKSKITNKTKGNKSDLKAKTTFIDKESIDSSSQEMEASVKSKITNKTKGKKGDLKATATLEDVSVDFNSIESSSQEMETSVKLRKVGRKKGKRPHEQNIKLEQKKDDISKESLKEINKKKVEDSEASQNSLKDKDKKEAIIISDNEAKLPKDKVKNKVDDSQASQKSVKEKTKKKVDDSEASQKLTKGRKKVDDREANHKSVKEKRNKKVDNNKSSQKPIKEKGKKNVSDTEASQNLTEENVKKKGNKETSQNSTKEKKKVDDSEASPNTLKEKGNDKVQASQKLAEEKGNKKVEDSEKSQTATKEKCDTKSKDTISKNEKAKLRNIDEIISKRCNLDSDSDDEKPLNLLCKELEAVSDDVPLGQLGQQNILLTQKGKDKKDAKDKNEAIPDVKVDSCGDLFDAMDNITQKSEIDDSEETAMDVSLDQSGSESLSDSQSSQTKRKKHGKISRIQSLEKKLEIDMKPSPSKKQTRANKSVDRRRSTTPRNRSVKPKKKVSQRRRSLPEHKMKATKDSQITQDSIINIEELPKVENLGIKKGDDTSEITKPAENCESSKDEEGEREEDKISHVSFKDIIAEAETVKKSQKKVSPRSILTNRSPGKKAQKSISPPKRGKLVDMPETPTSAKKYQSRASYILEKARIHLLSKSNSPAAMGKKKFTMIKPSVCGSPRVLIQPKHGILKGATSLDHVGQNTDATKSPPPSRLRGVPDSPTFRPVHMPRIYSPSASPSAGILKRRRLSGELPADSPSPPNKVS